MNFLKFFLPTNLWRMFARLGKVVDVFIYNKKPRLGNDLDSLDFREFVMLIA